MAHQPETPEITPMREAEIKFVSDAKKAWQNKKADRDWSEWMKIGAALEVLSRYALADAHTNNRQSPVYKRAFSARLRMEGFADMDASVRSKLLYLTEPENRLLCDQLRAAMSATERMRIAHPSTMAKRVKEYINRRDGEIADRQAARKTKLRDIEAHVADLEERLAGQHIDPDEVATAWLSRRGAESIARRLVDLDAAKAEAVAGAIRAALDDAEAFKPPAPARDRHAEIRRK